MKKGRITEARRKTFLSEMIPSSRIKNISDQLEGYAEEIMDIANRLQKKYDLSQTMVFLLLELAVKDQQSDVFHHIEEAMSNIFDNGLPVQAEVQLWEE